MRICRPECEILTHGIDLIVKLTWKRDEFTNESVTPNSPIEKMDAFLTAVSRPVQPIGSIKSHPILGGLNHHYVRSLGFRYTQRVTHTAS